MSVTVLMGRGLAAKDSPGLFRSATSSDPYFSAKFKDKKYVSEVKQRTLEPEWKSPPFDLGWITELEPKPLKIEVFDRDLVGCDDFMGVLRIPGHALSSLGPGNHMYWFTLSDSKDKKHRNQVVSGELLLDIRVEVRCCLCALVQLTELFCVFSDCSGSHSSYDIHTNFCLQAAVQISACCQTVVVSFHFTSRGFHFRRSVLSTEFCFFSSVHSSHLIVQNCTITERLIISRKRFV